MGRSNERGDGPRATLYEDVTGRVIAELEAGRLPWVKPWDDAAAVPALPCNAVSGRCYSGINVLLLWVAGMNARWTSHRWLTFAQALKAGGAVRKGERGTTIVYADRYTPDAARGESEESGEARAVPFLKRFTVFNVAQCDGLPEGLVPAPQQLPEAEIVPVAQRLIAASGIDVRIGGSQAYYAPHEDFVAMPPPAAFPDRVNFYHVCLHELTHATGHASRLARTLSTEFGSRDYAREELIAEMGSAFLCAALGIAPTIRHADYVGHWLDILRADHRAIFRAASAAGRAADWLLSRLPGEGRAEP